MRCNVTGTTKGNLYEFHVDGQFGPFSNYLVDEQFSFCLCQEEYDKFMELGATRNEADFDDECVYWYGKLFSSEQVYDLISTFQHPPRGYFCDGWLQFTEEEEQFLWDNMDVSVEDLVRDRFPERFALDKANHLRLILDGYSI